MSKELIEEIERAIININYPPMLIKLLGKCRTELAKRAELEKDLNDYKRGAAEESAEVDRRGEVIKKLTEEITNLNWSIEKGKRVLEEMRGQMNQYQEDLAKRAEQVAALETNIKQLASDITWYGGEIDRRDVVKKLQALLSETKTKEMTNDTRTV